ncbi:MAG: aldose 1-epimerase family protein [Bacteroidota bacterium]
MNISLENDHVIVSLQSFGGELTSVLNKETGLEYIWQAGKEWPKHSPVLFPIVGSLKEGSYIYHDKSYSLDRHGFARTRDFEVLEQNESSVSFILKSDAATLDVFPFPFELIITYIIKENKLEVQYKVINTGEDEMYFSIGAHPAFKVPLNDAHAYDDYYLEFNKTETAGRWPLNNGLLENETVNFFNGNKTLPLKKELFATDALVFENLFSDCISIKNNKDEHGLDFHFSNYPYFGIWAAANADFVCLEPWYGVTDSVSSDRKLMTKNGINKLEKNTFFTCSWSITVY